MTSRLSLLGLLRAAGVVAAALIVATALPRLGVPARLVPDLVVVLVAASAVLRGPVHGALLGLAAGWVVDLVPPGGAPLGLTALLYAAAGATAGTLRRPGPPGRPGLTLPLLALAAAAAVVEAGRVGLGVWAEGPLDLRSAAVRVAVTVAVGVFGLPLLLAVDRALVRRRLA